MNDEKINRLSTILSTRQIQCINHLLQGKTAKEIGCELGLSHRTVEHYLNLIKNKLGCNNKTQLIVKAHQLINRSDMEELEVSRS